MDYSNVVSFHALDGEVVAVCSWFTERECTLSEAKEMTKSLNDSISWFEMCFSSCIAGDAQPVFVVISENPEYGKGN